ncbi:MAG: arsenite methyltransferase [Chloroflexi bacterium]|nr:arsenite methyltransferase [Chloroflexota bacterium]
MTDVTKAVQAYYTQQASQPAAGCDCAQACDCGPSLYDDTLIADLPVDVTGLSLGCGDPVTIAGLNPGETVLDLGSGGGIDCFLAARQVGESGHVIGVDMTPAMLERANANRDKLGLTHVEFREGMIEDLPVEAGSVDVIMSNCVINLAPDKAAVFAEAFRVLKPGGRIAISDIVTDGDFSEELRQRFDLWSSCVTGAIDMGVYVALMEAAGFTDVAITDKRDAAEAMPEVQGMPRVFSARITARKPV